MDAAQSRSKTSLLGTVPTSWRAELAVFVGGLSSMGLEIVAGRLIAPEYGSSIYTWGSILGVFMLALAVGYWHGGRRASEHASRGAVARVLLYATLTISLVMLVGEGVLTLAETLPIAPRYSALVPILVLFGPPVYLMGLISPYAAELSKTESTGAASGRVYAVGTIGSIIGAFAATFVLVPSLSVLVVQALFASFLLFGAVAIVLPTGVDRWFAARTGVVTLVLVSAIAAGAGASATSTTGQTVHESETPYQHLRITDHDGVRTMYLNGYPQSAMYLDGRRNDQYVYEYARYAHLPWLYRSPESIENVLVIGGAGMSIPKRYAQEYSATVDIVEIDPEVVRSGKRYFNVSESSQLRIHTADGRQFLERSNTEYDVIVLDAYQKDQVPFHLTTVEFMRLAASHLDQEGVLVANTISAWRGSGSAFYRAEYKTMQQAFGDIDAYPVAEQSTSVQNVMLVATKGTAPSQATLAQRATQRRAAVGLDLSEAVRDRRGRAGVNTRDVPVLRDADAPVERLLDPLYGRRYVIQETQETNRTEATADRAPNAGGVPVEVIS